MMSWREHVRRLVAVFVLCLLLVPLALGGAQASLADHHHHGAGHHAGAAAPDHATEIGHGDRPCSLLVSCDHGHCAGIALAHKAMPTVWNARDFRAEAADQFDSCCLRPVPPPPRTFS